jgi:hypothetical protein
MLLRPWNCKYVLSCINTSMFDAAAGGWSILARELNEQLAKPQSEGRIGKQCRERWQHHLRPDLNKVSAAMLAEVRMGQLLCESVAPDR